MFDTVRVVGTAVAANLTIQTGLRFGGGDRHVGGIVGLCVLCQDDDTAYGRYEIVVKSHRRTNFTHTFAIFRFAYRTSRLGGQIAIGIGKEKDFVRSGTDVVFEEGRARIVAQFTFHKELSSTRFFETSTNRLVSVVVTGLIVDFFGVAASEKDVGDVAAHDQVSIVIFVVVVVVVVVVICGCGCHSFLRYDAFGMILLFRIIRKGIVGVMIMMVVLLLLFERVGQYHKLFATSIFFWKVMRQQFCFFQKHATLQHALCLLLLLIFLRMRTVVAQGAGSLCGNRQSCQQR
mmetsp:Transcript_6505/g.9873  ORF Transcript_6505/g.9873 Transcript_6505/m.9873 type:complete len:290 (+) Transcript_6505:1277-2146(+)